MSRSTKDNPLLATDVYKMGHMEQYIPGCNKVYNYYTNRSDKYFDKHVLFGLQYYLLEYLTKKLTPEMGEEFLKYRKLILGSNSKVVEDKIRAICELGYFPIHVKALPEGTITQKQIPYFTVTNTKDGFEWVPGFVESLLLKVWYPSVVATVSRKYRELVNKLFLESVDEEDYFLADFAVHDFGYRSDSSEEGAALSGVAHLLNFVGSDTVPAILVAEDVYGADMSKPVMLSVPASEHAIACSFGREGELDYFKNMLNLYPEGIVSLVSDQYDIYRVLTEYMEILKPQILARKGTTVIRPDSGNPEYIICGDPYAEENSPKWLGAIRLLDKCFGHSINKKGFKVLHPSIKLIYGDGQYYERYERTQKRLTEMGYSAQNLVIGIGALLRFYSRDSLSAAIKCVYIEVNGEPKEIYKDPITDPGKKSAKGLLQVYHQECGHHIECCEECTTPNGRLVLRDQCSKEDEAKGLLETVFLDGQLTKFQTLSEIRERLKNQ